MFCFYIFIETDEMGHTTCHSNLPLIKYFLLLCVLSVFVTLLLYGEFVNDYVSLRFNITQTVTEKYNWLRHKKNCRQNQGGTYYLRTIIVSIAIKASHVR